MSTVISRKAIYEYSNLRPQLFQMMETLDGGRICKGAHVVIKPNLLAPAPPEKAMLTHPFVVKGVVEYALEKGARVQISDSPAMGSFEKILKESGIKAALEGLDVHYREFKSSVTVEVEEPFRKLEIADDALSADFLINLPKLKTHSQMLLTLGVKNLFGCIVGFSKPQWHLRVGIERETFALLLLRIYQTVKPSITLLDGILAMEGQGPGRGGSPKHVGVLMGSTDAIALDTVVCRMLGVDPGRVPTIEAAGKMGLINGAIEVHGEVPDIRDFKLPEISPLVFGPPITQGFLRRHLVQRPVPDSALCKSCGDCWRYCPAEAISHAGKKVSFDYDKCIRCYCCIEVCPHGALKTEEPRLGKWVSRFMKRSSR